MSAAGSFARGEKVQLISNVRSLRMLDSRFLSHDQRLVLMDVHQAGGRFALNSIPVMS